jgi:hypothetical protein
MSRGPLRPPTGIPFVDPQGVASAMLGQIEYMFSEDGTVPDLREIDRAIGREPGEPIATAPGCTYLLERGYTIRATGTFDNEAIARMTPDEARAYLRQFYSDDEQEYFDWRFTPGFVAELQELTRRDLVQWQQFDYQWTYGVPTIEQVVALVDDGFVVDAYARTGKPVSGGVLVCSYHRNHQAGKKPLLKVYGLHERGLIGLYTVDQLAEVIDFNREITAITR